MFKRIALALLLLTAAPVVASAQGFVVGLMIGGAMFGGSNHYGGSAATILYSASDETLKQVDPMDIKLASSYSCFVPEYNADYSNLSLGEIFAKLMEKKVEQKRTVLQIARVFFPDKAYCASIWYAYVEK